MKYRLVCDDSNNTYEHELQSVVVVDFHFEGVGGFVQLTLKPDGKTTYAQLKRAAFKKAEPLFRQYPDQQVADELCRLAVKYSRRDAKNRR